MPGPSPFDPVPGDDTTDDFLDSATSDDAWSVEGEVTEQAAPVQHSKTYFSGLPGAATSLVMSTAGVFQRRRLHRIVGAAAAICVLALAVLVGLDLGGIWVIPGMGRVYDVTGMDDPNAGRAIARTEEQLHNKEIDPAERKRLQDKLLGLTSAMQAGDGARGTKRHRKKAGASHKGVETEGVVDAPRTSDSDMLAAIMGGAGGKVERKVDLPTIGELTTPPDLPEGLSQKALFDVISTRTRAMGLCVAAAMKAGEKPSGRLDVEMTIAAKGNVIEVELQPAKMRRTSFGECTMKTVKRWRFPRFNGEPVTVVFPYVLGTSF